MKISDEYPDLLTADGFDEAILGVVERINLLVVCYDRNKIIEILMTRDGMDEEEAWEYYQFNILDAYMGENTPVYLERMKL